MILEALTPAAAAEASGLHAGGFERPWRAAEISDLLAGVGGYGFIAREAGGAAAGFVLARAVAGEAEILTLAVDAAHRRLGIARALMQAATGAARAGGAEVMILEVAEDNAPAIGLYRAIGFDEVGRRPSYYPRQAGGAADALVMSVSLNSSPGSPYAHGR